jgi:hypothetical protein
MVEAMADRFDWRADWRCLPGLLVIDPDAPGPKHGDADGVLAWDELTKTRPVPQTRRHDTANHGLHFLFRFDPARPVGCSTGSLPEGIHVRGDGGYVIWPPSQLPDGRSWSVADTCETDAIADAPEWLYEILLTKPSIPTATPDTSSRTSKGNGSGNGAYARAALEGEIAAVACARPTTRNHTLNKAAFSLAQLVAAGALPESEVADRLYGAAMACGLVTEDGAQAVRATIKSGFDGGSRQPRQIPEPTTPRNDNSGPRPIETGADLPPPQLEVLDVGDDDQPISPRQWLLGNAFCRGFVSGLIAPGAGGKTSLRFAQALSLAANRSLTGEHVFVRCNVLIICLDDNMDEARRRVRAAMIHHGVSRAEVKGHLFLTTPKRMKMAQYSDKKAVVAGDLDRAVRTFIDQKQIDLVMVDPIKKAHNVAENSNDDMNEVVTILADLAIEKNIGVDLTSHERKASQTEAGDVNRARGAGSMKDGGRLMYTSTGMTEIEAKTFGVSEEERRFLFRVDGAKVNIAKPSATAQWFKLVSVNLENGSDTYPNGDDVQTVERWTPPGQFEGVSTADLNKALEKLGAGMGDGRLYSVAPSAKARAAWRVVQEVCPTQNEQQCRGIIATWVKNGVLTLGPYHDEKERRDVEGITGAKTVGVDIET